MSICKIINTLVQLKEPCFNQNNIILIIIFMLMKKEVLSFLNDYFQKSVATDLAVSEIKSDFLSVRSESVQFFTLSK